MLRQVVRDCPGIQLAFERKDPRGIAYFWIGGPPPSGLAVPGTDFHAVVNRQIAVTPIHLDLTGRRLLRQLKTWTFDLDASTTDIPAADAEATGPIDPPPDEG